MGPIIGLVPTATLFTGPDPFKDQYVFVNNYPKRIQQNGGVPIGLVSVDGNLPPPSPGGVQGLSAVRRRQALALPYAGDLPCHGPA